ncbi:MAG: hydroxymyristoyl-ACP dehydratase [Tannerella sp.]|jgi:predicted hotdog family 3-hydroxylacyl-ACP dehydratase|nr:hydroxymyristoyl-ACP dehydratase [Tannerella sp.]
MAAPALFEGERLHALIPQRAPMVMIDVFWEGSDTAAVTGLTVSAGNLFCAGGRLTEPGLVEHVAQSASALAGYKAFRRQQPAPTGYIGEIRKFRIFRLPAVGESLRTSIQILSEIMNVSLLTAETRSGDDVVASGQMKIFIREEDGQALV